MLPFQYLNIVGKDEAGCLTLNVIAPQWKNPEFVRGYLALVINVLAIRPSSNVLDSWRGFWNP